MDIRILAVATIAKLHLRSADDSLLYADNDQTKPLEVVLHSPGSKEFARAAAERDNRLTERLRRSGKTQLTPATRLEERATFLAACTKNFVNVSYDDLEGEALAKAIYSDTTLGFIADQVEKYLGDWANFTQASQSR